MNVIRSKFERRCHIFHVTLALAYNAMQRMLTMEAKRRCVEAGGSLHRFRVVVSPYEPPMKMCAKDFNWGLVDFDEFAEGGADLGHDEDEIVADTEANKLLNSIWVVDFIFRLNGESILTSCPS